MKREDIEFLKELQNEMLTQDTVGQANPRYWVVKHKVRHYGVDRDYHECNGEILVSDNGDIIAENLDELYSFLKEYEYEDSDFAIIKNHDNLKIIKLPYKTEYYIYNLTDFYEMMDELNFDSMYVSYYNEKYEIVENTMFLTLKECKNHIESNNYHYNDAIPFAMTAWRSPQVSRLYEIIQNTNWDE